MLFPASSRQFLRKQIPRPQQKPLTGLVMTPHFLFGWGDKGGVWSHLKMCRGRSRRHRRCWLCSCWHERQEHNSDDGCDYHIRVIPANAMAISFNRFSRHHG